ncbi:MAG: SusE domain-containing protein [Bacteroidales bacterium]|nr:SusE domain-containing protein [Bacteroides sp.]MCM1197346.1 SusE domain-containing protein [Clostridium sp.]MCM1501869.1 SusE domain-containing protein [Bacteroidales bacterium]
MKFRYMIISAAAGILSLAGCNKGGFQGPDRSMYDVVETMTLEVSAEEVVLDAEAPDEVALAFTWSPAREMPDDYIVTYVTYLDIEGNDFSNSVREVEDDGVYFKEYTNQQLQNLLVDKWGKNYSRAVNMQFKVIAKWDGGTKYIMPEVRTTGVSVRPFRPLTFDADRIFLSGEAVTGTTKQAMPKTPENEFIYAEEVYLQPGMMTIPIEYEGITSYICPADGDVIIPDDDLVGGKPAATEYAAVVKDEPKEGASLPAWNIPVEGYWRVIIDIENKAVKFFSPKNRLEPLTVEFAYEGRTPPSWILTKTLGAGNYYVNSMTGWDSWKGKAYPFVVSKTDPQLIIWQGSSFSMSDAFCVKVAQGPAEVDDIRAGEGSGGNNPNNDGAGMTFISKSLAFIPATEPGVASSVDVELKMGEWLPMAAAVSNRKWKPAAGGVKLSKITIDARNNMIRFD